MAAALLIPISIARFWSQSLPVLLWLAALFAMISALISTQLSMQIANMPTGPWMVVILGVLFALSWALSRGWVLTKKRAQTAGIKADV